MNVLERDVLKPNGQRSKLPARPPRSRRGAAILLAAAVVVALVIGAVAHALMQPKIAYITAPIARKDLVATVTATGTVNPQDTILVGTQVSGTVTEQDADFNTAVKKGQILTRLDPTSFQAQLNEAEASESQSRYAWSASQANIAVSQAALVSTKSQVAKAKAAVDLANLTVRRDRALLDQGYIPQTQFDNDSSNAVAAQSAYDAAIIAVPQAQAQLQAQIATEGANREAVQAQSAAVAQARYNFDNAVIRSQVNGTVIARNITIGQTVAASFQTPTLFTIGRDLTKMEVDVAVGEPDIGGVSVRDAVDFTVLAYPNRTFHGTVYQVRQNPTTINNVVTYDTVVYVENKDGALYPGMTANASIHVAKAQAALVVPIAALQWAPPEKQRSRTAANAGTPVSPWGVTEASLTRTIVAGRNGRLFVLHDGEPTRVPVRVVLVSGTEAAVMPVGTTLNAGDTVVTSDTQSQMASQQTTASSALTARPPSTAGRPGGSH